MQTILSDFKFYNLFDYDSFLNGFISESQGMILHLVYLPMSKDRFEEKFLRALARYNSRLNPDGLIDVHVLEYLNEIFFGIVWKGKVERSPFHTFDYLLERMSRGFKDNGENIQYGFSITVSNIMSSSEDIISYLRILAIKNYEDNLLRWGWKKLSRLQIFLNGTNSTVVIQPVVYYCKIKKTFSVIGGEAFIGGGDYKNFRELVQSIPNFENANRIYLLIIERTLQEAANIPGILKINIAPEILVEFFSSHATVIKFRQLVERYNIQPTKVYIELIEDFRNINIGLLKKTCSFFVKEGFCFSVDDFGVKSQSHEIILFLGDYIHEIKLDPISFKFQNQEETRFLDNLAFIDYCKKLANNRSAIITAEAVDSYETLRFLIKKEIFYFQCNLLCGKLSMDLFKRNFDLMQNLSEKVVFEILQDPNLQKDVDDEKNIFKLAADLKKGL